MTEQTAFLIAIIVHASIFIILFTVWFLTIRSGVRSPLTKSKSLSEQKMVLEAISACNRERNLDSLLASLGKHAAEMNGFNSWIIWLREDSKGFRAIAANTGDNPGRPEIPEEFDAPRLCSWVVRNASSAKMGRFAIDLVDSERLRSTLSRLSSGVMIPFIDGIRIVGFVIVGGTRISREKRSPQCLSLFGASAAILINNRWLHEHERVFLQKQERVEKLASMGKLAAGLAHEIRNPLGFIKVSVQHLQSKYEFANDDREITEDIVDEINRMNQRIEELLVLGRIDPKSFSTVDLEEVIRKVVRLAESKARASGIMVELKLTGKPAYVLGNGELLWQLFLNLILNGLEAMRGGGKLSIKLEDMGGKYKVEVRDSGCGIDEETAGRIFDPFFTTKESGTGLGLSIAFNVAQAHGGSLELVDTSTAGTAFVVSLPPGE
jgi:signal transduction histidine kinase